METPRFNRFEHMDSVTRKRIMNLIVDLSLVENCNANSTINMLYGSFDGFDYSKKILKDELLVQLKYCGNSRIANEIVDIAYVIKSYPKLEKATLV